MDDSLNYRVYLDHLTAAPCLQGAVEAITEAVIAYPGSLRSANTCGRAAGEFLRSKRDELSELAHAEEVHFCSSGSDANLTAVISAGRAALRSGRGHIISSRLEHYSVLTALRALETEGSTVSWLSTGADGRIDSDELQGMIYPETGLVTVQHSSQVTGILQPVNEIASLSRMNGTHFHSDFCSTAGRMELNLEGTGIDSVSISGLRIGGGPGAGALLSRTTAGNTLSLYPGSICPASLPAVAGMMRALGETRLGIDARARMVDDLRTELLSGLEKCGTAFDLVGGESSRLPGACLIRIEEPVPPVFHASLERAGIILPFPRSASRLACLGEMGQDTTDPERFVGFCLSPANTIVDIEYFLRVVTECIA
jgi:cysteine desulfurase